MDTFFDGVAKRRVREAVRAIEQGTAAEIVVAVRKRSWTYRHAHFLFGFVTALVVLIGLLFLPQSFDITTWPLEVGAAFIVGAVLCATIPQIERVFTEPGAMAAQVARAAKEAFVDLGVTRTRGRSGLLVYVSLRERRVHIVADAGLDALKEDGAFSTAAAAIASAVAERDFDAFVKALEGLAAPLEAAVPRQADDVNELLDEAA